MKKIFLVFILLLLIPITKVNGASCSYSELARLKQIASNVNFSYDYVENDTSAQFTVTLNNLNDEIYFIDQSTQRRYNYESDEITISNYIDGQTIRYAFYSTNSNCQDEPLYIIRVILPYYNSYYKDEVCIGAEDYDLCQKWYGHNLNHDEFVKKVTEYKNSLIDRTDPPNEEEIPNSVSFLQLITDFLIDYYVYIIIVFTLGLIAILAIRKKGDDYI